MKAEPGSPVPMFDHNARDRFISQQRLEFWSLVVDPAADLFDHLFNLVPSGGAISGHSLRLAVEVASVLTGRDPGVDGCFLVPGSLGGIRNDDGAGW